TGCSCDDTFSSQGVLHVWPWVVRTSAPCGSDSNFNVWSCSDEEFDDSAEEQPVSETPTAAATTTESAMRDMTSLLPNFCSAHLTKTLAQNVEMRQLLPRSTEKVCHQKNGIRRCPRGYPADFLPVLLFRHVRRQRRFSQKDASGALVCDNTATCRDA